MKNAILFGVLLFSFFSLVALGDLSFLKAQTEYYSPTNYYTPSIYYTPPTTSDSSVNTTTSGGSSSTTSDSSTTNTTTTTNTITSGSAASVPVSGSSGGSSSSITVYTSPSTSPSPSPSPETIALPQTVVSEENKLTDIETTIQKSTEEVQRISSQVEQSVPNTQSTTLKTQNTENTQVIKQAEIQETLTTKDSNSNGITDIEEEKMPKLDYQDVKTAVSVPIVSEYQVTKVELQTKPGTSEKVVKITGKAPPFSIVTIYIYSSPIVVVAKADENGNWEYILDKPLEDGQHSVYATVVGSKGELQKTSSVFDFVKAEDKIVEMVKPGNTLPPVEGLHKTFTIMIWITIAIAIFFTLGAIVIYLSK